MTMRAFGTGKKRNEGRWLLAGVLMATTALVMTPKAEAGGNIIIGDDDYIGISGDGRVVVGHSLDGNGQDVSRVYWPEQMLTLPGRGGTQNYARAINRAGNVIVGEGNDANNIMRAWRYVGDAMGGDFVELGTLAPQIAESVSYARGVSDDGAKVVGHSIWQGNMRAYVWVEGATGGVAGNEQMYRLGELPNGNGRSAARGISGNGRYVVGYSDADATASLAVRWDIGDLGQIGVRNLGSLTGMSGMSSATAASYDGSVIVGDSADADGRNRAFRWKEGAANGVQGNLEMLDMGTLGGQESWATAVTRDGVWAVGLSMNADDLELAFRWSEDTGMESVNDWLTRHGVELGGKVLKHANGISDDGNVIVGQLYEGDPQDALYQGYIARVDGQHGGGLMNVGEYQRSLFAAAGIADAGEFLTWLPVNGAHHRPLMLAPSLSGDLCAWATGDFAHHGPSATGLALAEMGACADLAGGNMRIGAAAGASGSWQDLAMGGSVRMAGQYILSEIDWQPDGTPLLLSLTGMLGGWQANIDRAYSNGAATAMSRGQANAIGGVVRLRADWLEAAVIGKTSLHPFASLAIGGLHVDGYSESGGPFPAVFDAQNLTHADIRMGVIAVTELSTQTRLSTTLEVAHRTGTGAAAKGHVPGLFDFSLGGGSQAQTWARAGAEIDHALSSKVSLSASTHLASSGRDPTLTASVGLKGSF
ncbi:autotransporter domain-containing protein [Devosia sp.]|uniref:autotransporter domain-containing protein n=1 Tax=Devosia sp. TaxID=1871048 RepID=UPI002AFDE1B8|nr:autotransporter domain-containing protein [Devosia sp.]